MGQHCERDGVIADRTFDWCAVFAEPLPVNRRQNHRAGRRVSAQSFRWDPVQCWKQRMERLFTLLAMRTSQCHISKHVIGQDERRQFIQRSSLTFVADWPRMWPASWGHHEAGWGEKGYSLSSPERYAWKIFSVQYGWDRRETKGKESSRAAANIWKCLRRSPSYEAWHYSGCFISWWDFRSRHWEQLLP